MKSFKRKMLNNKFWERYFKVYDTLNSVYPYRDLLNLVIRKLPHLTNRRVLDVGSGTGNLSILLAQQGARVISLDNSKIGLNIHSSKESSAEVFLHDLNQQLPFKDNSFDIIVSLNTICFLSENKREFVFQELYRVLRTDGKIIVVNLLKGFKSVKIFMSHISSSLKKCGLLQTVSTILFLFIPALKMFYYSNKIKKHSKKISFFEIHQQHDYLSRANFKNISKNELVFANQAVLNEASK